MKRITIFLLPAVLLSSCGFLFNAITAPMIVARDCYIDTRTLTFYYNGGEIVEGVNIYLQDDKKSIQFINDRYDTKYLKMELDSLRPVLTRQGIVISVERVNTHWRDYQRIEIEKEDWTKKKRVNSIHTHH